MFHEFYSPLQVSDYKKSVQERQSYFVNNELKKEIGKQSFYYYFLTMTAPVTFAFKFFLHFFAKLNNKPQLSK